MKAWNQGPRHQAGGDRGFRKRHPHNRVHLDSQEGERGILLEGGGQLSAKEKVSTTRRHTKGSVTAGCPYRGAGVFHKSNTRQGNGRLRILIRRGGIFKNPSGGKKPADG